MSMQAPECPWWCTAEHVHDGWDEVSGEYAAKRCHRDIPGVEDVDGEQVAITVERFARLTCGEPVLDQPMIRVEGHGPLLLDEALAGAFAVMRAVEIVNEPPPVRLAG